MPLKTFEVATEIAGKPLLIKVGKFARFANGSAFARYGETAVLATVTMAAPREEVDYFPLTVDYVERLYAGGRIKGSRFVKREGRPSDEAILAGRMIDRSLRPLFPKDFKNEVQVVVTVLSVDLEQDPALLGLLASSAALSCSDVPWEGPVGAVRVGEKEGAFLLNPTLSELDFSSLDLVVTGTKEALVMVEAGAKEVPEDRVLEAMEYGYKHLRQMLALIEDLTKKVGPQKQEFEKDEVADSLKEEVSRFALEKVKEVLKEGKSKGEHAPQLDLLREELYEKFEGKYPRTKLNSALSDVMREAVRDLVVSDGKRVDGREFSEVRPISAEVGILARTHGSALFERGETQVLTIATLGSGSLEQLIEGPMGEETKRYLHHYYFPPFSTGETGRIGSPNRREIGHSALAERALLPMIPSEEEFPYAIRLVTEVLSSNGSTSMAAVCGSALALMDAGVPIKAPVSGIAMGLFKNKENIKILTDITGLEDQSGDMDFKVAGTKNGITALQMDVKVKEGLSHEILKEALSSAKSARLFVLERMLEVLGGTRKELSAYAPKVVSLKIDQEKIGDVIGPGGRVIRSIIESTQTAIDVSDDGTVLISSTDAGKVETAKKLIEDLVREVKAGEEYEGEVKRVMDFGAFVEVLPGKEGLLHVSEISHEYVDKPEKIFRVGQKVRVKVIGVDERGRINLSKKVLEKPTKKLGFRTPDFRKGRIPFRSPYVRR